MAAYPPSRRWFQFGLQTMFVAVTVLAVWLGYDANWIRQRRDGLVWISEHAIRSGSIVIIRDSRIGLPWPLRILGEQPAMCRIVRASEDEQHDLPAFRARLATIQRQFPECQIKEWAADFPYSVR